MVGPVRVQECSKDMQRWAESLKECIMMYVRPAGERKRGIMGGK